MACFMFSHVVAPRPRHLGGGGQANVFLESDPERGWIVVKKFLPGTHRRTIAQEKEMLQLAQSNPYVVKSFPTQPQWVAMEYVQGGSLGDMISKVHEIFPPRLKQAMVRFWIAEIVLALEKLHNRSRIVFKDLNPDNILVRDLSISNSTIFRSLLNCTLNWPISAVRRWGPITHPAALCRLKCS